MFQQKTTNSITDLIILHAWQSALRQKQRCQLHLNHALSLDHWWLNQEEAGSSFRMRCASNLGTTSHSSSLAFYRSYETRVDATNILPPYSSSAIDWKDTTLPQDTHSLTICTVAAQTEMAPRHLHRSTSIFKISEIELGDIYYSQGTSDRQVNCE